MSTSHNIVSITEFIHRHIDRRPRPYLPAITMHPIIKRPQILATSCKARLIIGRAGPFYDYDDDAICMPSPVFYTLARVFRRPKTFALVALHEITHWSGARNRLDRPRFKEKFDPTYIKEELVAELGSALLCHDLAITSRPALPHAAYLNRYLAVSTNPRVDLAVALSHAQMAAAYLVASARHRLPN